MKKLFALPSLALAAIIGSILMSLIAKTQTSPCDWFTGTYRGLGRGVIVHLGANRVVVYNSNSTPLDGRCINNERIEVRFRSNLP